MKRIKDWLRFNFGTICWRLWCPGELVNSKLVGGTVYWRCTKCGAHTQPK